ncbi:hypothetical protein PWT90_11222 [Aphanocladium album]|nr:hypothetical protein PWT90_11222 [Aphanocladium album]
MGPPVACIRAQDLLKTKLVAGYKFTQYVEDDSTETTQSEATPTPCVGQAACSPTLQSLSLLRILSSVIHQAHHSPFCRGTTGSARTNPRIWQANTLRGPPHLVTKTVHSLQSVSKHNIGRPRKDSCSTQCAASPMIPLTNTLQSTVAKSAPATRTAIFAVASSPARNECRILAPRSKTTSGSSRNTGALLTSAQPGSNMGLSHRSIQRTITERIRSGSRYGVTCTVAVGIPRSPTLPSPIAIVMNSRFPQPWFPVKNLHTLQEGTTAAYLGFPQRNIIQFKQNQDPKWVPPYKIRSRRHPTCPDVQ